jgi:two-component system sensor histidine kinase KdpD
LETDPVLAQRVLEIFIGNACRFSPAGSPVRVTAGVADEELEILVIDRGPGMSATQRSKLLEPSQRLSPEGASLGLSVASGFVDLLEGQIRLEDTPGGGLTAVVQFPLTNHEESL